MANTLHFLLFDDNPDDRNATIRCLSGEFPGAVVEPIADASQFADALQRGGFDLVLTEYSFHWSNGLQVLGRVREKHPGVPVIMFTAGGNEEMAVEGMKAGLDDYIPKSRPHLSRLIHSIRHCLERVGAERALKESRRTLDTLMRNLPGLVYRRRNDPSWTMEFVSDGCAALTGYDPQDLIGNLKVSFADRIHPDDQDQVWRQVREAIQARRSYQLSYRIRAADDIVRWVWEHGCGVFNDEGVLEALEGFISDITPRKDSELRLQRVHAIYRKAIQNARGVPYELHFDDGKYAFFAEGIETLLGHKVGTLTQKEFEGYIQEIVVADPDVQMNRQEYSDAFLDGRVERWLADYLIRDAEGNERWLSDCSTPIRDETTGQVIGSLGILYDVSDRRRTEQELRNSNRFLSALSAISRTIAFSRTPEELSEALANELRRIFSLDAFYMEAFHPDTGKGLGLGNYDTMNGVFQRVPFVNARVDRRKGPLALDVYDKRRPLVIHRTREELNRSQEGLVCFGNTARRSASLAYVPLIVGERVIGIMSIQSYTPGLYGPEEVALLEAIAGQVAPAVEGVLLSHQLLKNSETLRSIITGTWATTGADYFRSLARHLASAFGVRYALLGEVAEGQRIRTLAVWAGSYYVSNFEFSTEGTIFEEIQGGEVQSCPQDAHSRFPADATLQRFRAESCLGTWLRDSAGAVLGVLEVMHTAPMDEELDLESLMRVFAGRAGAELERLRAERALRTSEEKYRNLFENALVGMFRSRISDGLLLEANRRMAELAGYESPSEYVGRLRTVDTYVDPGVRERMVRLIEEKGEVNNFEARIRRRDGKVIWIQYSAKLYKEHGYIEGIAFDITRQKEIEHALRETNETLQAVVQASPLAIVGFGPDQNVLMWNAAAERIFGWSRDEVVGAQVPIVPQLEFDNLASLHKRAEREKSFSGLELRRRRKTGEPVDISLSMAPLRDPNGRAAGAVAIISDITDKKRLESERETFAWLSLQLVEADKLESIADVLAQALDMLFCFDCMYFTQRRPGSDVFYLVRAMDIIDGARRIVAAQNRTLDEYRQLGRLVEGEPYLLNRQRDEEAPLPTFGDHTRRSASLMYSPIVFGGEVFGVLSVQSYERNRYGSADLRLLKALTDLVAPPLRRVQAETELRRSEARNRALLGAIPDMITVLGADGVFRDYRASRDSSLPESESVLGKHVQDVFPASLSELTLRRLDSVLRSGAVEDFEYQVNTDGRAREYEARMSQCGTEEVLMIVRDITDRKHLDAQLRQAQKMEAIGRLAGGIAHDFNNLLTGIVGNLGIAQLDAPPEVQPLIEEAMKAGQRAAGLVSQLLAFGRKSLVSIQPADVVPILKEVIGIVRNTFDRRIEVVHTRPASLRHVMGDAGQIHQVMLNLLVNARDALTPLLNLSPSPVLRIALEAENFDADDHYVEAYSYARPGRYVVLSVTDTGIGMDEETKKHLFEPFFTTKELGKGTGLGLATIYGIVKQHNGWIHVYSESGRGSTFRIYLPAVELPVSPEATPENGESLEDILPMSGGSETILVADDEAFIRRLARRVLEPLGYTVLDAADGEEALEVFRRANPRVDLVILDLSMPKMSGQETLSRLRVFAPDVRVVLSSGYAYLGDLPEEMGTVDYISKPYRPAELARLVRKVLDA